MTEDHPILGLLQNPWAHDAKKAQKFMDRGPEERRRWIMSAMPKSQTGRRLRRSLGENLFDLIVWDNADPTVSGKPWYQATPDADHVARLLDLYTPNLIICYGKTAEAAVEAQNFHGVVVTCCHPTYRHKNTIPQLAEAAQSVKTWLSHSGYCLPTEEEDSDA